MMVLSSITEHVNLRRRNKINRRKINRRNTNNNLVNKYINKRKINKIIKLLENIQHSDIESESEYEIKNRSANIVTDQNPDSESEQNFISDSEENIMDESDREYIPEKSYMESDEEQEIEVIQNNSYHNYIKGKIHAFYKKHKSFFNYIKNNRTIPTQKHGKSKEERIASREFQNFKTQLNDYIYKHKPMSNWKYLALTNNKDFMYLYNKSMGKRLNN